MTVLKIRPRALVSVAIGALQVAALVSVPGTAKADSLCSSTAGTFECQDSSATAAGTFTLGATQLAYGWGGLAITNPGDLGVSLAEGEINTTGDFERAVFLDASGGEGGTLSYVSNGTATSAGMGSNTVLIGNSVVASALGQGQIRQPRPLLRRVGAPPTSIA